MNLNLNLNRLFYVNGMWARTFDIDASANEVCVRTHACVLAWVRLCACVDESSTLALGTSRLRGLNYNSPVVTAFVVTTVCFSCTHPLFLSHDYGTAYFKI